MLGSSYWAVTVVLFDDQLCSVNENVSICRTDPLIYPDFAEARFYPVVDLADEMAL